MLEDDRDARCVLPCRHHVVKSVSAKSVGLEPSSRSIRKIHLSANMGSSLPSPGAVLLLIDLQQAIDHPSWGERNNPDAERRVSRLLVHWRRQGWPVWHVRHDSTNPNSHYWPGQSGHAFKPEVAPMAGEPVIVKQTNSAFIGTDLESRLCVGGHDKLVVAGVITNNSVEATVRMAGNLGFQTWLVADGCFTFARADWNGTPRSAEDIHAMSLANLDSEYCTVTTVDALLRASS
jgi:nicotinamidase-related amidase